MRLLYNEFSTTWLSERLHCNCPNTSYSDINWSFGNLLQQYTNRSISNATDNSCNILRVLPSIFSTFPDIQLPSTCTGDTWNNDGICQFTFNSPLIASPTQQFQFTIAQCPNQSAQSLPYISISCAGDACTDIGLPCNTNTDCPSSHSCNQIYGHIPDIVSVFINQYLHINNHSILCNNSATTITQNLLTNLYQLISGNTQFIYTLSSINLCGISGFTLPTTQIPNYTQFPGVPDTLQYQMWYEFGRQLGQWFIAVFSNQVQSFYYGIQYTGFQIGLPPFLNDYYYNHFLNMDYIYAYGNYNYFYNTNTILSTVADYINYIDNLLAQGILYIVQQFRGTVIGLLPSTRYTTRQAIQWAIGYGLLPWNGTLTDGTSATSADRLTGTYYQPTTIDIPIQTTYNAAQPINVLILESNSQWSVLGNSPVQLSGYTSITQLFGSLHNIFNEYAYCNSDITGITQSQINEWYDFTTIDFWLNYLTGHNTVSTSPSTTTPLNQLMNYIPLTINITNMPYTCTPQLYQQTGTCQFELSLFNSSLDLNLRISINRATQYGLLPRIVIDCIGNNCQPLLQPYITTQCVSNTNCTLPNQICIDAPISSLPVLSTLLFTQYNHTCDSSALTYSDLLQFVSVISNQTSYIYSSSEPGICVLDYPHYINVVKQMEGNLTLNNWYKKLETSNDTSLIDIDVLGLNPYGGTMSYNGYTIPSESATPTVNGSISNSTTKPTVSNNPSTTTNTPSSVPTAPTTSAATTVQPTVSPVTYAPNVQVNTVAPASLPQSVLTAEAVTFNNNNNTTPITIDIPQQLSISSGTSSNVLVAVSLSIPAANATDTSHPAILSVSVFGHVVDTPLVVASPSDIAVVPVSIDTTFDSATANQILSSSDNYRLFVTTYIVQLASLAGADPSQFTIVSPVSADVHINSTRKLLQSTNNLTVTTQVTPVSTGTGTPPAVATALATTIISTAISTGSMLQLPTSLQNTQSTKQYITVAYTPSPSPIPTTATTSSTNQTAAPSIAATQIHCIPLWSYITTSIVSIIIILY